MPKENLGFGENGFVKKDSSNTREIFKQRWEERLRKVLFDPRPINEGILYDDLDKVKAHKYVSQIEELLYKSDKNVETFSKIIRDLYGKEVSWAAFLVMDFIKDKYHEVYHEYYSDEPGNN